MWRRRRSLLLLQQGREPGVTHRRSSVAGFRGAAHRKKTPHGGRDLQLALAVSEALDRHDLARAIGTVADREGLTDNRVEKAWRAYRDVLSCEADMIDGKK